MGAMSKLIAVSQTVNERGMEIHGKNWTLRVLPFKSLNIIELTRID